LQKTGFGTEAITEIDSARIINVAEKCKESVFIETPLLSIIIFEIDLLFIILFSFYTIVSINAT